jgi:high affinity sulfate transporter 1
MGPRRRTTGARRSFVVPEGAIESVAPAAVRHRGPRAERWIPGIRALRTYQRRWLARDLVAAAVLSALLVPQGMAYAELAGLPAITGLYTTVVCLLAYAALGSSRYLVIGPDSSLGPIIAAIILPLAAGSEEQAIALAGMLALLVGAMAIGAGLARLGFVADLLSKPVRIGYMAGLAVTIVVSQLPALFGFSAEGGNLVEDTVAFLRGLDETVVAALAMGVVALAIILGLRRSLPAVPGILVAVVVTALMSAVLDLAARGVPVVGDLPQGFPRPSFPSVDVADLPPLIVGAFGIMLVAVSDTISTSSSFAARRGVEVDTNQEIIGIGGGNAAAALFSGFPVSTSGSRTAVAEQAGAKSQLTGVAAAGLVLAMLVFVPGLLADLPDSVLAAVVITASISLFDVPGLRRLWVVQRSEFGVAAVCFVGVAMAGVLLGIVVAVIVSVLQIFVRAWRPHQAELGREEGYAGFHDLTRHPNAERIEGLILFRWDAPLFFANSIVFRDAVRDLLASSETSTRWVVIAAEPITDIDSTAADVLIDLDAELERRGVRLVFAELKGPVKDKARRYGLDDDGERQRFYPTVDAAVEGFEREAGSAV